MKKQIIATVLMAAFAAPAFAKSDRFKAEMFDNPAEQVQAIELSKQEMIETEGQFIGHVLGGVMGGVAGHLGYMAGAIANGEYNRTQHLWAIFTGAASGSIFPVEGFGSAVAAFGTGFAFSTANTYMSNKGTTEKINIGKIPPQQPTTPTANANTNPTNSHAGNNNLEFPKEFLMIGP